MMSKEAKSDSKKDNFKIYNYLKKEPSIIIAVSSALIAVVTAILSFVATSIQKQYFTYWNIPISLIEYNTASIIHQLCASAVICLFVSLCMVLINIFFAQYFKECVNGIQERTAFKKCNKLSKKIGIRVFMVRILLFVLEKSKKILKGTTWLNLLQKCRTINENCQKLNNTCRYQIDRLEEVYNPQFPFPKIKLVAKIGLMAIAFFGISLLFSMANSNGSSYIRNAIYLTVFTIVSYSCLGYWTARIKVPKKEINRNVEKYLRGECDWQYVEYENEYNPKNTKDYFTDSAIKKYIVTLVLLLSFVLVYISIAMMHTVKQQKVFHTVEYQNETYVVLHRFDDNLVLEKATITENELNIMITKQIIVNDNNITIEYRKFDNVNQITTDGNEVK